VNTPKAAAGLSLILALSAAMPAAAAERFEARSLQARADSGVVAGNHRVAFRGPRGAAGLRGRRTVADRQGDAATASAGAWRGTHGGDAARVGETSRSSDGSWQHQSGFAARDAAGDSVSSHGRASGDGNGNGQASFARETDASGVRGSYAGSTSGASGQGLTHTTQLVGANGRSYEGETSISKTGITHAGSCSNAAGQAVACP
jgi:hypothetical protein